jgi:small subunit ribosomal protein S5
MIKATFAAFNRMVSPRAIAAKRGKKVGDIIGRREGDAAAAQAGARE